MAHGSLTWHKVDCGYEHCDDTHWDAVILRDNFRLVIRVTKHWQALDPNKCWNAVAFLMHAQSKEDAKSFDNTGITLCTGDYCIDFQNAAAAVLNKFEEEHKAVMRVASDLVIHDACDVKT